MKTIWRIAPILLLLLGTLGAEALVAPARWTARDLLPRAGAHGGQMRLVTPPETALRVLTGALLIYKAAREHPVLSLTLDIPEDGYYRVTTSLVYGPWRDGRYGMFHAAADDVPIGLTRDVFHGWYGRGATPAYRLSLVDWGIIYLRAPSTVLTFTRDDKQAGDLLGIESVTLAAVDAATLTTAEKARRVPERDAPPRVGPACIIESLKPLTWVMPVSRAKATQIDGDLAEWALAKPSIAITAASIAGRGYGAPSPESDADLSLTGALTWDDAYLYFAATVRDNELAKPGEKWLGYWSHDGVVLSLFLPSWVEPGPKTLTLGFNCYLPDGAPRELPGGARYSMRRTKDGYTLEAAVPFAALGYTPREDDRLHAMLIPVDIDPSAPPGRTFQQYLWNTRGGDAARWGELRLMGDKGWAATLTPEKAVYASEAPLRYIGVIDVFRAGLRITALEVANRVSGVVYISEKVNLPLPANQRIRVRGELALPALPAGEYDIRVKVE